MVSLSIRTAHAQETNHNFAKWEKSIAAFEHMDATNAPPKNSIIFIGSSTIARWSSLAKDFPGLPVLNRGFGGSEIVDSTHFAPRVIFPCSPKMVILRAGGNDLWAGKTPERVFKDFKEFAATIHSKLPDTEVVFLSLNPSIARWIQHDKEKELNRLIAEFIKQTPHAQYWEAYDIPMGADGEPRPELFVADKLHFNAQGYKLLAARVKPLLTKK